MTLAESEQAILAFALVHSPDERSTNLRAVIRNSPDAFADQRHGLIASEIRELILSRETVCPSAVEQALQRRGLLERAGGASYLANLPDPLPEAAAEFEAETVWQSYQARRLRRLNQDVHEEAEKSPHRVLELIRRQISCLEELILPEQDSAQQLRVLDARRFDGGKRPPPLRPIYSVGDAPIATPGNISVIAAQVKAGKSAFLEAMMAAAVVPGTGIADTLGVVSSNPMGGAIVHLDTEQAPDDHWMLVDRMRRRAKLEGVPTHFRSVCLTGLPAIECRKLLPVEMDFAAEAHGGIHSVFVDGFGDLVADINDAAECNAFVAELHALAIKHDCPIIGVLHMNPGTEKTRGHLGSQLERKAETNLQLAKTEEVVEVFSTKQRRAPILRGKGPRFAWDATEGMHLSSSRPAHLSALARKVQPYLDEVFPEPAGKSYSGLKVTLMRVAAVAEKTAERWIREALIQALIEKGPGGIYTRGVCEK